MRTLSLSSFLLAAGCGLSGTPSTLELAMSGTLQAPGGEPVTLDVSGPWKPSCEDECVPRITDGGDSGYFAPQFRAPTPEDVFVTLGFRLGFGVKTGPGAVPLEIGLRDTGAAPLLYSAGVVVDRSYFTGDTASPWRIDLLIDGTMQDPATATDVTMSGAAALLFTCTEEDGDPTSQCGGDITGSIEAADSVALTFAAQNELTCPTAVLEHFWRPQAATFDEAAKTMRVGDAEPMQCSTEHGFCGASAEGIEADGCTWRVDVLRARELYIHGKASGCERENVYCSDVLFPQTGPA